MDFNNAVVVNYFLDNLPSVTGIPGPGPVAYYPLGLSLLQYVPDRGVMDIPGVYINDRWEMGKHVLLNLGLRYDAYKSRFDREGKIASSSAFSPRLGVKCDLCGDARFVAGLAWNRLMGRPLENIYILASHVNLANNYMINWASPAIFASVAMDPSRSNWATSLYNPANWNLQPNSAANPAGYILSDPSRKNLVDPGLRPPHVDEFQLTFTCNFRNPVLGEGYIRATAVEKRWGDLVDNVVGQDGVYIDPTGLNEGYRSRIINQPLARKEYRELSVNVADRIGALNLTGSVVWNRLTGNMVGDGTYGLENFSTLQGVPVYSIAQFNPVGRLVTNGIRSPLTEMLSVRYNGANLAGPFEVSLLFRFASGTTYDQERFLPFGAFPTLAADPVASTQTAGTGLYQYLNGQRGTGVNPATSYLDLGLEQSLALGTVRGAKVIVFGRANIRNIWNHQQIAFIDGSFKAIQTLSQLNTPFVPANPTYGKPVNASYYGDARSYLLSCGVRF